MNQDIKVYVNKGFYINSLGEKIELNQRSLDVWFKDDHDQAIAAKDKKIDELANNIVSHNKMFTELADGYIDTISVLEAKLRVCKQQRNGEIWQPFDHAGSKETVENYDNELDLITIDLLKKMEQI